MGLSCGCIARPLRADVDAAAGVTAGQADALPEEVRLFSRLVATGPPGSGDGSWQRRAPPGQPDPAALVRRLEAAQLMALSGNRPPGSACVFATKSIPPAWSACHSCVTWIGRRSKVWVQQGRVQQVLCMTSCWRFQPTQLRSGASATRLFEIDTEPTSTERPVALQTAVGPLLEGPLLAVGLLLSIFRLKTTPARSLGAAKVSGALQAAAVASAAAAAAARRLEMAMAARQQLGAPSLTCIALEALAHNIQHTPSLVGAFGVLPEELACTLFAVRQWTMRGAAARSVLNAKLAVDPPLNTLSWLRGSVTAPFSVPTPQACTCRAPHLRHTCALDRPPPPPPQTD